MEKRKFSDIANSIMRIQQNFLSMPSYDSKHLRTQTKRRLLYITYLSDHTYFAGSLNIFALMYIIPFKVELDSHSDLFRLKTTKMRQLVCGIIHATGVIMLVFCGYLKCFTYDSKPKRFEYIIYALDFGFTGIFTLTVIKVLWRNQHYIEAFLNTKPYRTSVVPRYKVFLATTSCLALFLCDMHINRTPGGMSGCRIVVPTSWDSPCVEIVFIAINYLFKSMIFLSQLSMYIGEALCCALAITMWEICKKLNGKLVRDTPFQQGLEIYNEHRVVVETVNKFASGLFFTNLMSSLVYYAQAPIVYYFGQEMYDYEKVIMMSYIFITLIIWGFAGECHSQTRSTIKKWVTTIQEKADESTLPCEQFKLTAISYNLDSDPIALSCSFFNITYGFEVSMLGLLISYNIIIFQMEEQGNPMKPSATIIA